MPSLAPEPNFAPAWTIAFELLKDHPDGLSRDELVVAMTPEGLLDDNKSRHVSSSLGRLIETDAIELRDKKLYVKANDLESFKLAVASELLGRAPDGDALFSKAGKVLYEHHSQIAGAWAYLQRPGAPRDSDRAMTLLTEQLGNERGLLRDGATYDPLVRLLVWSGLACPVRFEGEVVLLPDPTRLLARAIADVEQGARLDMGEVRQRAANAIPWLPEGTIGARVADLLEVPVENESLSLPIHVALERLAQQGAIDIVYGDDALGRYSLLGLGSHSREASGIVVKAAAR